MATKTDTLRRRSLLVAIGLLVVLGLAYWLLDTGSPVHHLEWIEADGYRWAALEVPRRGEPGFKKRSIRRLGIEFKNNLTEDQIVHNRNLLNGSGVALGDVTGNGFVDIYFARLNGPNKLYENLGGWQFRDITDEAGVALPHQFSTGAVFADLNGNGHLDLVVTSNDQQNRVFFNDGAGIFTEQEGALRTDRNHGSTSIALADVTGNGALDVYIANYKQRSVRDIWPYEQQFRYIVEREGGDYRIAPKYVGHYRLAMRDSILVWFENGEPDLLFLNDGTGNFGHVPLDTGILLDVDGEPITDPLLDWGLHAKFQDMNGNGLPDLYVANDFESPDRIWLNQGDGTFRALPRLAMRKSSLSSMAVDFSDINRNGHLDFFVVEMLSRIHEKRLRQMGTMAPSPQPIGAVNNRPQYMGNTLFLNRGDGTYAEVSEFAGVRRSDWSWSALFLDVNLDGYEDIIISTGHHYDVQDSDANSLIRNRVAMGQLDQAREMLLYPKLEEQNALFQNLGDGTFEEVTEGWGFLERDVSHGMALADLDNTGTLDLVVNRLDYEPAIYRNTTAAPRVAVRLRGESPNTFGTGAKIHFLGGPVPQTKEVTTGGTYLSGSDPTYVFAPGDEEGPFTIEVYWRSGRKSIIEYVERNRIYEVFEAAAAETHPIGLHEADHTEPGRRFFEDVSERIDHRHHENHFRDFERQPMLPYRLSRLGPGISWFDATGDGYDDLFVASGRGGAPAWYRNMGHGTLVEVTGTVLNEPVAQDQSTLLGWYDAGGNARLWAGSSNWETRDGRLEDVQQFVLGNPGVTFVAEGIAGHASSTGALAMADFTGNGRLDLFVAGRATADRYPEPASSRLYRQDDGGRFVLDEDNTRMLERIGLVTGAVFSDLDDDGWPDLVLAREWGSLAILKNRQGTFEDVTADFGLDEYVGWWNGVATGDLNRNGRLDIVATNWGTNHSHAATSSREHPARLYYADFNGDGIHTVLEAYHAPSLGAIVPRRSLSIITAELPFIRDHLRTYEAFAASSLDEILGERIRQTDVLSANTFEHMVFLNRGDHFEAVPLPEKAQWAPAFHVAVGDLNGNGHEDLFLSQNFFSYQLETPRSDAGRASWLRGDGTGAFEAVPGHDSGILVYGEQRGAALSDFDGDGRLDIAVTQNGAPTRLFRNSLAAPGVRVRLRGGDGNLQGIGARMRLLYPDGEGPVREVQAGSGYWSQNSAMQVLGMRQAPEALWVRWPDGTEHTHPLPGIAVEIEVDQIGTTRILRELE